MRERVQYKILIVDDSRMNRVLLKKYLCDAGYQVVEAENGKVGRELARSECPDLILLDIQMPVEDGFEAIGKLKMDGYTAQIPVIFLSGISDVAYKVAGFENGAVDFITKPFDAEEVKARVKVHIKISLDCKRCWRISVKNSSRSNMLRSRCWLFPRRCQRQNLQPNICR